MLKVRKFWAFSVFYVRLRSQKKKINGLFFFSFALLIFQPFDLQNELKFEWFFT